MLIKVEREFYTLIDISYLIYLTRRGGPFLMKNAELENLTEIESSFLQKGIELITIGTISELIKVYMDCSEIDYVTSNSLSPDDLKMMKIIKYVFTFIHSGDMDGYETTALFLLSAAPKFRHCIRSAIRELNSHIMTQSLVSIKDFYAFVNLKLEEEMEPGLSQEEIKNLLSDK